MDALLDNDNKWVYEDYVIKRLVLDYYKNLFTSDSKNCGFFCWGFMGKFLISHPMSEKEPCSRYHSLP